ncbi:MAG: hypothetical protein AABY14_04875 [Nanoarchaeota archaeon]
MATSIQIQERTLDILKKIKEETRSVSYDEAINKLVVSTAKDKSLGGYLGKRPLKWILNELRDKSDR